MHGVAEFSAFCADELWDCQQARFGRVLWLRIHREDPRRQPFWDFLSEVRDDVGICFLDGDDDCINVYFDECGAAWASMVFKIRTSFVNPGHRAAALRRDRKDQLEMLGIYASTHRPFGRKLMHPAIRRLQMALGECGYDTKRDGIWDFRTRMGLWSWRRRHHLKTPPYITEADLNALEV